VRIAFVPPRYGLEVVGGAEYAVRMFAENLVAAGDDIEIFTTCARDATTWTDAYPEGTEQVNGVPVHRFRSTGSRSPGFGATSAALFERGVRGVEIEERWVDEQGPVCPAALDAVASSDADAVVFYPYLYWPTVHGVRRLGHRTVVHPAAHDEPPLRLAPYRDVMSGGRALVFQTEGERDLVRRTFAIEHLPQLLLGLGVEPAPSAPDGAAARAGLGLGDRPFLLCLGRVDDGKGASLLARLFTAYKARHPGPLALVFAGPVVDRPPAHPDVFVAGVVDDTTKWGLLAAAEALVNPSPNEAFSIVLMEAWTAGLPVVVNAACAATREHCARSSGGLWFSGAGSFEAIVARLHTDPRLRARLGAAGAAYVERRFLWPSLIDRYRSFLARVL
jgi:glycosyltransferase involved in cell wall biosynthesis